MTEATQPRVCVIPYGTKIKRGITGMKLADCFFPLEQGLPDGRDGDKTIADLSRHDHVLTYPTSRLFRTPFMGMRAKLSLIIAEPRAIHGRHMRLARLFSFRFHRILTSDEKLLRALRNARKLQGAASTWVHDWRDLEIRKSAMLSVIASKKAYLEGHKHRHDLVSWLRDTGSDASILGHGYQSFENKSDGLVPFRYSAIIENVAETGYFTEKLIDALLCETVPIYWGAPDIEDYFDTRGMIICRSLDDLKSAANSMSVEDYEGRREAIARNKELAAAYEHAETRAANILSGGL